MTVRSERTAKTSETKVVASQTGPAIKKITIKNVTRRNSSSTLISNIYISALFTGKCENVRARPLYTRTRTESANFLGRGRTSASSREGARKAATGRSDPSQPARASSYLRGLHSHKSTDGGDLNAHAASHALTSAPNFDSHKLK